ncbi:putative thiosulfate sulfurtransferase [Colletotrichum aenigma]|uniref:putative thiosulfate sulfurtransferase n=1 Tax=Colletotrichum aenigma TaxID=1215731 RepID=UPI001872E2AF|nr:putative thiosulfate sulfurtransferase [Colletotrichum aenigma]KAF5524477.1 putative thiosulfate sulfurtransferase [Colletotrichum aenigma]
MSATRRAYSNALRASGRIVAPAGLARQAFAFAASSSESFRPAACATANRSLAAIAPRFYSSKSGADDYHEISATGSKLWSFEQMEKLAKDGKPNVVIIDAREPGELVQTGCIPGAINIPVGTAPQSFHMTSEDFEDLHGFKRPGQDQELIMYCKAGVRSRALASLAKEAGWKNIGEYPGSWLDWEKNGGPVQKKKEH